jgi:hypothetical protein
MWFPQMKEGRAHGNRFWYQNRFSETDPYAGTAAVGRDLDRMFIKNLKIFGLDYDDIGTEVEVFRGSHQARRGDTFLIQKEVMKAPVLMVCGLKTYKTKAI